MNPEIEKYLHIKGQLEQSTRHAIDKRREEHKTGRFFQVDTTPFWFGVSAPFFLAILFALAGLIEPMRWIYYASWGLIALSYTILFIYPIVCVGLYRDSVRKVVVAPFASLAGADLKTLMTIDAQCLASLAELSVDTLRLGALELKNERSAFRKSIRLITGTLENIGLFPGLLALAFGLIILAQTLFGNGFFTAYLGWIFVVAVVNLCLYLLCGYAKVILMRDDRMIALTELAAERGRV